ncbi:sodium/hydrogen exchanger 9B2-like isoform X1 [Pantherophis guttatus]|uniref:Sodium/hydrogen exchanger 9B2-like isoform X1 n=1 Tax=Pantherophis guttatus TaxID=94885 RepID=A0A6P9E046_PANGU|nr:sodium/hydrogen exchanger 9B2-like isoform X1 [Pantherophis guttatus]
MSERIPGADKKNISSKSRNEVYPIQEAGILDSSGEQVQTEAKIQEKLKELCTCPPQGVIAKLITNVAIGAVIWGLIWSLTGKESLPGGSIFGIVCLYFCSVIGGKIMQLIKIPGLPPLPPFLGMLIAGFLIRNIEFVSKVIVIKVKWGIIFRNIALSIILSLAGLGLDAKALNKLKAVCFRLCLGPCITEACSAAVLSHFIMKFPWVWGFMLGFVLGAVSPAVVVLSMLMLQRQGLGVDQGIPTLLIAAASIDDIVAITGFNIFLGMAFSSGSTFRSILRGVVEVVIGAGAGCLLGFFITYFPSKDQKSIAWKRAFFVIGLSAFSLLCSKRFGFPGSGGLCVIVLSFLAGMAWSNEKKAVQDVVTFAWQISQPFLFGLIGAEISVSSLGLETVGLCLATMFSALMIRIVATFLLVSGSGFHWKEKLFIALAWIPKATVQAAIGSVALDTARGNKDKMLEKYGLYILTIAFLAILITAPTGAVIIGLTGPRLLRKTTKGNEDDLTMDNFSSAEIT